MKECPTCRSCFPDEILHCPDDGAATTTSISGEPILDGRYQLEKRLGQGGMGSVYLAFDSQENRQVAVKVLAAEQAVKANVLRRFQLEGQNGAMLVPGSKSPTSFVILLKNPNGQGTYSPKGTRWILS